MRIGYDAKRLFHNRRGLGNYSRALLSALGEAYPGEDFFLYTPSDPQDELSADFRQMPFHIRTAHSRFSWYWRSRGILKDFKRDEIKIYHGLSHELPYGIHNTDIKSIVTVHDIIFHKYPQYFNLVDRSIYRWKLKYALRAADIVHCISHSTAEDVMEVFDVPKHKIKVIPPILDEHFLLDKKPDKPTKLPDSYFLYVGAFVNRKNLLNLISAWKSSGTQSDLVFVGNGPVEEQINEIVKSYNLDLKFHHFSDINYEELPTYYAHAKGLIYVSEYEGFGLPLMEAAAASCPVITSDVSSMPEVLGDASIMVNPLNVESIEEGIHRLEGMSESEVERMNMRALEKVEKYRGNVVSAEIKEMYS